MSPRLLILCYYADHWFLGTSTENLATFNFTTGKIHRLRLINPSAEATQRFTIDNHIMTIIANDFVPVKPYETNVVTLGVSSAIVGSQKQY